MKNWQPVAGHIMTRWTKDVTPDNVWSEYPRPQMVRSDWLNLNGLWQYDIRDKAAQLPMVLDTKFDASGEILVPFPLESALSGVKRPLLPTQHLWYKCTFTIPPAWQGQKLLLHFGAVDWEATVWVNDQQVGIHRGGYTPFSFDISEQVRFEGENELVVAVWDPTDNFGQERGKQVLEPKNIWYTAVSGIWQTVWLEPVPHTAIIRIKLTPDIDNELVKTAVFLDGEVAGIEVQVELSNVGELVAQATVAADHAESLTLPVLNPKLWSPTDPFLYDLRVTLRRGSEVVDQVTSYVGMRKFGIGRDENGSLGLQLNNQPIFQFGPLDQGYWPDGLYCPPTDEALRYDIEICKQLGFNMMRKHVKVEPARFYYHCDRLGIIVHQDMPNGGSSVSMMLSTMAVLVGWRRNDNNYRKAGRNEPENRQHYRDELQAMVDALYNAACIGMWVPFNEGWGQFEANDTAAWLKEYDPTRPVDHASGWFDQGGPDFKSLHIYGKKLGKKPPKERAVLLSEFGGFSLKLPDHIWYEDKEYGYRKFGSSEALTAAYIELLEDELVPWIANGLSGAIYTQTTDVEGEVNGYLTYDREVMKMDVDKITAVHRKIVN
jgi:beta-galactosidase/beta-glucuronidase